jgi:hypothetical protein
MNIAMGNCNAEGIGDKFAALVGYGRVERSLFDLCAHGARYKYKVGNGAPEGRNRSLFSPKRRGVIERFLAETEDEDGLKEPSWFNTARPMEWVGIGQ